MYRHENAIYTRPMYSMFDEDEVIKIWFTELLIKYNKRFISYLTINEINNEIKYVKDDIKTETLLIESDSIHEYNANLLNSYLDKLNELLEERKKFEKTKQEYWREQ